MVNIINMETKQIPGNDKYLISIDGNSIFNTETEKYISISDQINKKGNASGYKYCTLLNGKWNRESYYGKRIAVHRIVLISFKGYEHGKPWVNHKDGNKNNNHLDNLEWTTISENIIHSYEKLGRKMPKGKDHWNTGRKNTRQTKELMSKLKLGKLHPKYKGFYLINGKKYYSSKEAEQKTGMNRRTIQRRCLLNKDGFNFVPDPNKEF